MNVENKQQTAVDWFIDNLPERFKNAIVNTCKEEIEQAKVMEKEKSIDFAKHCLDRALDLDIRTSYSKVEQYYNDTYEK